MKRTTLLLSGLLFSIVLFGQDYAPFPLGQRSFWSAGDQAFQHFCDHSYTADSTTYLFFGENYLQPDGPCLDTIISFFLDSTPLIEGAPPRETPLIDTLAIENGRLFSPDQVDTYFDLNATPGSTWTVTAPPDAEFDEINWTFLDQEASEWAGQTMEIRQYEGIRTQNSIAIDTLSMLLSDQYGFVQFVPFADWWSNVPRVFEMIGIDDPEQGFGYQQTFEDFFDIEVGSIFKYSVYQLYNRGIIRDSVIAVTWDADGVEISTWRLQKQTKLTILPDPDPTQIDTIIYTAFEHTYRVDREAFLDDFTGPPGFLFYESSGDSYNHYGYGLTDSLRLDSLGTVYMNVSRAKAIFWGECVELPADAPCPDAYGLGTCLGYTLQLNYTGLSCATQRLIGYQSCQGSRGDTSLEDVIVSTSFLPAAKKRFELYPNPVTNKLNIKLPAAQAVPMQIRIKDLQGRLVYTAQHQPAPVWSIDLSHLANGQYWVELLYEDGWGVERFVKQ